MSLMQKKAFDFEWAEKVGVDITSSNLPVLRTSQIAKVQQAIAKIIEKKNNCRETKLFHPV